MNIPPKYEDVVAKLDAALGREAALREELDLLKPTFESTFDAAQRDRAERDALQQRLTFAEQREAELEGLLHEVANLDPRGEFLGWQLDGKIDAALKPAAEPHKCIECESQYCHGVCVERGDDDECYKGAEGEGS